MLIQPGIPTYKGGGIYYIFDLTIISGFRAMFITNSDEDRLYRFYPGTELTK